MLNLQQLHTFVTVIGEGSMTAAADKLYLTQPAVSQQIRNLEEEMGVELLVRGVRQIKATPQGEILYEHSKRLLQQVQQAEIAVKSMGAELKGHVRIGTLNSIGLHIMSPIVSRLMRHNPELLVRVDYQRGEELARAFKKGQFDVIIIPEAEAEFGIDMDEGIEARFLLKEELWLVGSGRDSTIPPQIPIRELSRLPFVNFVDEFPGFQKQLAGLLQGAGLEANSIFESSNVGTLKRVIEAGLGWGFLPSHSIKKQVRGGRLTRTHVKDFQYEMDLVFYYHRKGANKVLCETFYQALSQERGVSSVFTRQQKIVIAILAFLQFTIILDFMIISPLGAVLMPALGASPSQFGLVVSAYAFAAGTAGLLAAGFADRFDRKKLLLFFYAGFVLGTFLCGVANTFAFLLAARTITGLFGGVIGSIVFAITTDLFPLEQRGRVMGFIQTAFAGSQVLGLPFGIYLSNHWGWHAPFLLIAAISLAVGGIIWTQMPAINAHLKLRIDRSPFHHLWTTVSNPWYLQAFATTALLSIGGFMLMPFGSAFSVHNLGLSLDDLPMLYMVTGLASMIIGPAVGKASDRFGQFNIFAIGSLVSIVLVSYYTRMGPSSLGTVMVVNVIMFIGIFSRMIPAQALMSAIPSPDSRGSFMSVSSSLQQISGGLASVVAGWLVAENADSSLRDFDHLGNVMVGTTVVSLVMMYFIRRTLVKRSQAAAKVA